MTTLLLLAVLALPARALARPELQAELSRTRRALEQELRVQAEYDRILASLRADPGKASAFLEGGLYWDAERTRALIAARVAHLQGEVARLRAELTPE